MSQDLINLKLVGFSEYEAQIIESVLSLAERGLLKNGGWLQTCRRITTCCREA
jgi:hypothetical protein